MLGNSYTSFAAGVPEDRRGATAFGDAPAALLLSGEQPTGTAGETRQITALTVVNSADHARWVSVGSEATGQSVSANVPAGQTVTLAVPLYGVTWRAAGPIPNRWDGLNVRWKDPA